MTLRLRARVLREEGEANEAGAIRRVACGHLGLNLEERRLDPGFSPQDRRGRLPTVAVCEWWGAASGAITVPARLRVSVLRLGGLLRLGPTPEQERRPHSASLLWTR